MNVFQFTMRAMGVFMFQNTNGHDIIADGFGLGIGIGIGISSRLFIFTGTKRGVVIVQEHAQIGCIVGMMHCTVMQLIGAQLVLHNLHQRTQLARVQTGVRNHDGCAGQHQQGKKREQAREIHCGYIHCIQNNAIMIYLYISLYLYLFAMVYGIWHGMHCIGFCTNHNKASWFCTV